MHQTLLFRTTPDQEVSLNQFRGRPTILAFYPADFSPVCRDQMTLYNDPTFFINGIRYDDSWDAESLEGAIKNTL
jgi:peroxiredoxin